MPTRPSTARARRSAAAALLVLGLTSCSSDDGGPAASAAPQAPELDERLELLSFEGGAVGVPDSWDELPAAGSTLASYGQPGPDGTPVGQLDVITSTVPAGSEADALDASAQANRALQVRSLESVDREPVEAEGATSAFRTEATYELPDGSSARSLEQSTVGEDGTYVLVRYSAGEQDYAEDLATAVLDSISVGGAEA